MDYKSGDINVTSLRMFNKRSSVNTVDYTNSFIAASIYESIFTPGSVCDILINDTQDVLGTMKLIGDELISFEYTIPGSDAASFVFALYDVGHVTSGDAQNSKQYVLKCVSQEVMFDKINNFQKSYNMLCSQMISDVHKNHRSIGALQKPIVTEATNGSQNILIPGMSPMGAINLIKKRSISQNNPSNSYVYFENRLSGVQTFNFITIEGMFKQSSIKTFYQSTMNIDFTDPASDANIIAYKVDTQLNSLELLKASQSYMQKNILTAQQINSNTVSPNPASFKSGGVNELSDYFKNTYVNNGTNATRKNVIVDYSPGATENHIVDGMPYHEMYKALLGRNSMRIRVIGDTVITPGVIITCNISNKTGLTGPRNDDTLLSGNFLVTRVHHRIGDNITESPRYTCILECIKGGYNTGVST